MKDFLPCGTLRECGTIVHSFNYVQFPTTAFYTEENAQPQSFQIDCGINIAVNHQSILSTNQSILSTKPRKLILCSFPPCPLPLFRLRHRHLPAPTVVALNIGQRTVGNSLAIHERKCGVALLPALFASHAPKSETWGFLLFQLIPIRNLWSIFTTNAGRRLYDRPNASGVQAAHAAFHRQTILDALAIENAVVVGHSTGGLIAQTLAALCPRRCRALVLSGSWVKADAYIEALFRSRLMLLAQAPEAYDRLALFLSYPPDWLAQRADLLKRAAQGPATCAKGRAVLAERIEALLAFDGTRALAHILMPVLVMSAADDHVIPAYHQRCLATILARAEAQVFESGGHFFPQTRAEGFCQALGDWYWRIAASI